MKNYKIIMDEIKQNQDRAKELEAKADALMLTEEKHNAKTWGERKALNDSITAKAESEALNLYYEAENLKRDNRILSENVKASFAEYTTSIIKDIMQKYSGKQYGEKTKQKIWDEAHAHGIGFYFERYYSTESSTIKVYCMSDEGYKAFNMPEIELHATTAEGHHNYFISNTNKINDFSEINITNHYSYTENPTEKREAINQAYEELNSLIELAVKAQAKYNELLPLEATKCRAVEKLAAHNRF